MTTIVYRDGVLAADSRAYSGDKHPIGTKRKIERLPNGVLVGCSSCKVGAPGAFMRWLREQDAANLGEAMSEDVHPVQAIVVAPNGDVFYWQDRDSFSGPIEADFFAIGSGEAYAYGALAMGATAKQAVYVAAEADAWTGGLVHSLELKEPGVG